jgi:hypothetical protein
MPTTPVYLEVGAKRVFACSFAWPGWTRPGRDEDTALEALVEAAPRYRRTLGAAARDLTPPKSAKGLRVVERVRGNATTDFGAPGVPAKADDDDPTATELERLVKLVRACWRAFDRAAAKAEGVELRKGPRGGGRDLHAIVEHVLDADGAYLGKLGGAFERDRGASPEVRAEALRAAFVEAATLRVHGEPPPKPPKRAALWPVAYAIRRSAWHAVDHVWEIEDRSER